MYGTQDIRLEDFDLREMRSDELLARIVCDSVCMSTHKMLRRPADPKVLAAGPIIIGHEFAAKVERVGEKVADRYAVGDNITAQVAMVINGLSCAPGYTFTELGGDATHVIIPSEVASSPYIVKFSSDCFFKASLAEPLSCIISALRACFHFRNLTTGGAVYVDKKIHIMGIVEGGKMAVVGGCGPMGLAMVELTLAMDRKPGLLVVTDIDESRLARARRVCPPERAAARGVRLVYVNIAGSNDPSVELRAITGGTGFDDILVMVPMREAVETSDRIAAENACISFFAGPPDKTFSATVNFYDVHYKAKHIIGTISGDVEDIKEALAMIDADRIRPEVMITHVGGLNSVVDTTLNLPSIGGGKKLIYTNIDMELTAIEDLDGKTDPLSRGLFEICARHEMLWSREAEEYLLKNAKPI